MSYIAIGGGIASVAGGIMSSDATKSAANTEAQGAQQALAYEQQQVGRAQGGLTPYQGSGTAANAKLAGLLGLAGTPGGVTSAPDWNNPVWAGYVAGGGYTGAPGQTDSSADQAQRTAIYNQLSLGVDSNASDYGSLTKPFSAADLAAGPVYNTSLQFGLDEGLKGVNRAAAANGGLDSGADLKAITQYATNYGGTKASDAYSRYLASNNQIYQMLSGTANAGQTAATTAGNMAVGAGSTGANLITGAANAGAAGTIGSANAISSGISGGLNSYTNNSILNALTGGGARGGSAGGIAYNPVPSEVASGSPNSLGATF